MMENILPVGVPYGTIRTTLEHIRKPRICWNRPGRDRTSKEFDVNTLPAEKEAARLWRRLPAAERRAGLARVRADRTGRTEHVVAALELEAGLARMEAAYYEQLAQVI